MKSPAGISSLIFLFIWLVVAVHPSEPFAAQKPDWVEGTSKKYPDSQYLIGVGSGDTRQAAEDSAYGAISRVFHTEISQKTEEWEKFLQEDTGRKTTTSRTVTIDQLTQVSTKKVLEGVKITDAWEDEKEKRVYALAVMDRAHTTAILRDRIQSLDAEAQELVKRAGQREDKIQTVRNLRAAVKALLLREVYNAELRIVSPSARGIPPAVGLSTVNQDLRKFLMTEINIGVEVAGPHGGEIRTALLEGLTQRGFSVAGADGGKADSQDVLVRGKIEFQPVPNPQFKFIRWTAEFELVEKQSGKVFGSILKSGREGHLNLSEAENRSAKAIQEEMKKELTTRLAGFLYGEEE
jgi:hypothetical protein